MRLFRREAKPPTPREEREARIQHIIREAVTCALKHGDKHLFSRSVRHRIELDDDSDYVEFIRAGYCVWLPLEHGRSILIHAHTGGLSAWRDNPRLRIPATKETVALTRRVQTQTEAWCAEERDSDHFYKCAQFFKDFGEGS